MRIISFFILLFVSFSLFSQTTQLSSDTLHWKESKPLSWADFKGKPKAGTSSQAYCMLKADYEKPNPLKKTKFKIFAVWDRNKSWITAASKTSEELLYYQVLFNIYEVHARKLRKEFSETKFGLDPEKTFRIKYQAEENALTEDERNFRDETEEGTDVQKVKEWDEKIKKQLKELAAFPE